MKRVLEEIQKDSRNDFQKTSEVLRALGSEKMDLEDRATWIRLSRAAAIRVGDANLLKELAGFNDPFSKIVQARVIMANGRIEVGDFEEANAELAQIKDIDHVNPRERRRYWALKAKIARLSGEEDKEVAALAEITRELAQWPTPTCQSCHNDQKNPTAVPTLDLRKQWFIDRYVELLKKRDRAANLKDTAAKRLVLDPKDIEARLFLYVALAASASNEDAEKLLHEISWIGRQAEGDAAPRLIFAWP